MKTEIIILVFYVVKVLSSSCTVLIQSSWAAKTIVPSTPSIVMLRCPFNTTHVASWAIQRNNGPLKRFNDAEFNLFGMYMYEENSYQFLFVNDTLVNNNTAIRCISLRGEPAITTITIYDPQLKVVDIEAQRVNITWSPLTPNFSITENYTLAVSSSNKAQPEVFQLNQPYLVFTSDDESTSCAIHTFVVHTRLSSSIHSGNCVSESNTVQQSLPSLPNITSLESSIEYSLAKQTEGVVLTVSFLPASICNVKYNVSGYSMDVMSQSEDINSMLYDTIEFTSPIMITANDLEENTEYSFRIVTSNSVGNSTTGYQNFYTTDVQNVTVRALENEISFVVQCRFITGSAAKGCLVMLESELGNITANLTRDNDCNCSKNTTVNVTQHVSCYNAFVYDIDNNGSVGTLAVPVVIFSNINVKCTPMESMSGDLRDIILGVVIAAVVFVLIIVAVAIVTCLFYRNCYKDNRCSLKPINVNNSIDNQHEEGDHENRQDNLVVPVYDQLLKETLKNKAKTRTPGDGDDAADHHYNTTSHVGYEKKEDVNSSNNNNYSELNEDSTTQIYHVLENNGGRAQEESEDITPDPDAPALPPPFKPDPPPVFMI